MDIVKIGALMKRKKIDKPLLIAIILMSLIGILMIYSASNIWAEYRFHDALKFVKNQTLFFILSLILCIFLSKINPQLLEKHAHKYLSICFILLILNPLKLLVNHLIYDHNPSKLLIFILIDLFFF